MQIYSGITKRIMTMRMDPKDRKNLLLETGLKLAEKSHYLMVKTTDVGAELNVAPSLVLVYFRSVDAFRKALVRRAIKTNNWKVVAQAMVQGDPLVKRAPVDLKRAALKGVGEKYGLRN